MRSTISKPLIRKKSMGICLLGLVIFLTASILPAASLTVYEFKIKNNKIDYGDKLEISIVFVGNGVLRIKNVDNETIMLLTLKKGGEYTYEINTEGLLYPGDYYAQVLDENGNEVANESFKVVSTYTVVVVTIGEGKKTQSYLYDILIVPTTLKAGNNTLDVFFGSNTYSKGGADVYLEVPESWSTKKVRLDEINFKNHVQLPVVVPESAYGSYILTLHVDTTFGKFNHSFAVSVEGTAPPTPMPSPTATPTVTPIPTSTPMPTQTPTPTPIPTPTLTPSPSVSPTETPSMNQSMNQSANASTKITPEKPTQTPGFEVYAAILAVVAAYGIVRYRRRE